jgi:hypothetical protein
MQLLQLTHLPRSNKHGRKRPHTKKYDDLHVIVLRSYISVSYTDENTIVYGLSKRRLHTISEFVRIFLGKTVLRNCLKVIATIILISDFLISNKTGTCPNSIRLASLCTFFILHSAMGIMTL